MYALVSVFRRAKHVPCGRRGGFTAVAYGFTCAAAERVFTWATFPVDAFLTKEGHESFEENDCALLAAKLVGRLAMNDSRELILTDGQVRTD